MNLLTPALRLMMYCLSVQWQYVQRPVDEYQAGYMPAAAVAALGPSPCVSTFPELGQLSTPIPASTEVITMRVREWHRLACKTLAGC